MKDATGYLTVSTQEQGRVVWDWPPSAAISKTLEHARVSPYVLLGELSSDSPKAQIAAVRASCCLHDLSGIGAQAGLPSHRPFSRGMRDRGFRSRATSEFFSNSATAPSTARTMVAVGESSVKCVGALYCRRPDVAVDSPAQPGDSSASKEQRTAERCPHIKAGGEMIVKGLLAGIGFGFALVLAGCGGSSKVSGTYHQAGGGGVMTLEFESGKVTSTVMGQSNHGTYEVKGDQVIMHLPGEGDVPLKINGDGTLDAPAFGTFSKKN